MIHFIVFSKNRPLQLDGYLSSFERHVDAGTQQVAISVIVNAQLAYHDAYAELARAYSRVEFVLEQDFATDVQNLIREEDDIICFGCDDVVFIRTVNLDTVAKVVTGEDIFGLSLRLGADIYGGMFSVGGIPQPHFEQSKDQNILTWKFDGPECTQDWIYPWDVLGMFYPKAIIKQMQPSVALASGPSWFEQNGSQSWQMLTQKRHLACWNQSRIVVPTVNIVQDVFPNGTIGPGDLSAQFLLECWQHNLRLDIERYDNVTHTTWRIGDFFLKRI